MKTHLRNTFKTTWVIHKKKEGGLISKKTTLKIPPKRVRYHLHVFMLMLHSLGNAPYFF